MQKMGSPPARPAASLGRLTGIFDPIRSQKRQELSQITGIQKIADNTNSAAAAQKNADRRTNRSTNAFGLKWINLNIPNPRGEGLERLQDSAIVKPIGIGENQGGAGTGL